MREEMSPLKEATDLRKEDLHQHISDVRIRHDSGEDYTMSLWPMEVQRFLRRPCCDCVRFSKGL